MKNSVSQHVCPHCKQPITANNSSQNLSEVISKNEDEIVEEIKTKAVKATMKAIRPLLDKLEEAAKQQSQEAQQSTNTATPDFQSQMQMMQAAAREKMKMRELKVQAKMRNFQGKIAKRS
ncbi:hypothetical protein U8527_09005 [Kordia algicida OT-1]|uniref:Uncharacterized protein n=1 Tax=Kordia algicida OT-1 TaxID=391587 RepID=A9DTX9_9FLAO|nr:hypothetical protein [Kordia algicida]EDP96237.1 hypothetical protein KAOT1_02472 [Kordia algicida OT-1]